MQPAVRVDGLSKRFGERTAVADLTFEVARGEVFGFLGPNGAGKTTTVRILTTLLSPSAGTAEVAGIPIDRGDGTELRRRIGVMPEAPGLYLKLSVEENLRYFTGLYGFDPDGASRRIDRALEQVGLVDRRSDLAGSLSKGLRQRAALARALLVEPEVLFLDEPTAGLDPEASVAVRELIDGLGRGGRTVFLTTHRLEEAERLCDRVAIVSTRLVSLGSPTELREARFAPSLEVWTREPLADADRLFATAPGVTGWEGSAGRYRLSVSDPAESAPALARALVAQGADVLRIAEATRSLEDAYLELIEDSR